MYLTLFNSNILYLTTSLILIVGASLITRQFSFGFRMFLFGFGPFFAVAFYITSLLTSDLIAPSLSLSLLFFEISVFIAVAFFLQKIMNKKRLERHNYSKRQYAQYFWRIFLAKLGILLYLSSQQGFGVFSSGSRIEYLNHNSINLWLTYLSTFLSIFITCLLLNRSMRERRLDRYFYYFLILKSAETILGGSKGAVILWLVGYFALYLSLDRKGRRSAIPALIAAGSLAILVIVVTIKNFGLSTWGFVNLVWARFFLVNDGRALSIDLQSDKQGMVNFLTNSFRSISNVLGFPPTDLPIGQVLYSEGLGMSGVGSNGSYGALVAYYLSSDSIAFFIAILGSIFLGLCFVLFFLFFNKYFRASPLNGIGLFLGVTYAWTFSQDFLAFQVMCYFLLPSLLLMFCLKLSSQVRKALKGQFLMYPRQPVYER